MKGMNKAFKAVGGVIVKVFTPNEEAAQQYVNKRLEYYSLGDNHK